MAALRIPLGPAAVALLVLSACGGAGPGAQAPEPAPDRGPDAAERERLEAIYEARRDSARMRFTDADVAFVTGMIAHHAQAVLMSRLVPERTDTRAIRTLAARIINGQQDEIALMQQWLRERGQPVPEVDIEGTTLMVHGPGHDMEGPGMLSPAELEELAAARGDAFDRLFLENMIRHHQGAVAMVHDLFAQDGAGQDETIFRLASDIQVDQKTEIARMQSMLANFNRERR